MRVYIARATQDRFLSRVGVFQDYGILQREPPVVQ